MSGFLHLNQQEITFCVPIDHLKIKMKTMMSTSHIHIFGILFGHSFFSLQYTYFEEAYTIAHFNVHFKRDSAPVMVSCWIVRCSSVHIVDFRQFIWHSIVFIGGIFSPDKDHTMENLITPIPVSLLFVCRIWTIANQNNKSWLNHKKNLLFSSFTNARTRTHKHLLAASAREGHREKDRVQNLV